MSKSRQFRVGQQISFRMNSAGLRPDKDQKLTKGIQQSIASGRILSFIEESGKRLIRVKVGSPSNTILTVHPEQVV